MNRANKIYLERLRKDDFVDRSPESNIVFEPMTLNEFSMSVFEASERLKKASKNMSDYYLLKKFQVPVIKTKWIDHGDVEFTNPIKKHWTENL